MSYLPPKDSQRTESRQCTDNMPLKPDHAASITAAKRAAHGGVPRRIESAAVHSKSVCCSRRWWCLNSTSALSSAGLVLQSTAALAAAEHMISASRLSTLSSFHRAGRRLYRCLMVHQCWCSTSTVRPFSFSILTFFFWYMHPAFVLSYPRFSRKERSLFISFAFVSARLDRPYNGRMVMLIFGTLQLLVRRHA